MEKERKSEIINTYKRHDGDTGSAEVQIALLTERINHLLFFASPQKRSPPPAYFKGYKRFKRFKATAVKNEFFFLKSAPKSARKNQRAGQG